MMVAVTLPAPKTPSEYFVQKYINDKQALFEEFDLDEDHMTQIINKNDGIKFLKRGSKTRLQSEAIHLYNKMPLVIRQTIKAAFDKMSADIDTTKNVPSAEEKLSKEEELVKEMANIKVPTPFEQAERYAPKQAKTMKASADDSLAKAIAAAKALIKATSPTPIESNLADEDAIARDQHAAFKAREAKIAAEREERENAINRMLAEQKIKDDLAAAKKASFEAGDWTETQLLEEDLTEEQWNYVSQYYPISVGFFVANQNKFNLWLMCLNPKVDMACYGLAQFDYDTLWASQSDRCINNPSKVYEWFQYPLSKELMVNIFTKCQFAHNQLEFIYETIKNNESAITHMLTRQPVSAPLIEKMVDSLTSAHWTIIAANGNIVLSEDFFQKHMNKLTPNQFAKVVMNHEYLSKDFLNNIKHFTDLPEIIDFIRLTRTELNTQQTEIRQLMGENEHIRERTPEPVYDDSDSNSDEEDDFHDRLAGPE